MTVGLLAADVEGWAFDCNNNDIIEYCTSDSLQFRKDFFGNAKLPTNWDVDFVFCPWHRQLPMYRARTVLGALRSQYFDAGDPKRPTLADKDLVRSCAAFQVVTRSVYDYLKKDCLNVCYLTNPVNMKRFRKPAPKRDEIICCWNGNAQHWSGGGNFEIKGLYSILLPATSAAMVKFVISEYNTCRLAPDAMPYFYQKANVALCGSAFEGASNSVMEAMASGLAVIATDVGNHREMRDSQLKHYGDTGIILVDRNYKKFADEIRRLSPGRAYEMGQINRKEIQERWSWDFWRDDFIKFFKLAA